MSGWPGNVLRAGTLGRAHNLLWLLACIELQPRGDRSARTTAPACLHIHLPVLRPRKAFTCTGFNRQAPTAEAEWHATNAAPAPTRPGGSTGLTRAVSRAERKSKSAAASFASRHLCAFIRSRARHTSQRQGEEAAHAVAARAHVRCSLQLVLADVGTDGFVRALMRKMT